MVSFAQELYCSRHNFDFLTHVWTLVLVEVLLQAVDQVLKCPCRNTHCWNRLPRYCCPSTECSFDCKSEKNPSANLYLIFWKVNKSLQTSFDYSSSVIKEYKASGLFTGQYFLNWGLQYIYRCYIGNTIVVVVVYYITYLNRKKLL